MNEPTTKNPNAVALGRLNLGKKKRPTTPEATERRRQTLANARAILAQKRAALKAEASEVAIHVSGDSLGQP